MSRFFVLDNFGIVADFDTVDEAVAFMEEKGLVYSDTWISEESYDDYPEEHQWLEMGFDPYEGCYTYDC